MQLKKVEKIEKLLQQIHQIIAPEDAYQICDAIIVSLGDELLEEHIKDTLKTMNYDKEIRKQIVKILKQIQK